ncbi:hypothetical protein [Pantoea agglomerans]|uniref:hypothetical protein n=1 Tax=Enterobacter agglomerans TaxID=549 RepID=UPI001E5BB006|nr:hypothetical protein [Pantoea agglomerans]
MSFNNKNLFLPSYPSAHFQTYATQCKAEILAKNKVNNFILTSQQTRTEIPKSVSITTNSPDGYLRTSVQSNFSQCGELIGGRMEEVKTSMGQKTVFTATSEVLLNKTELGWRIQLNSNGFIADKNSQKPLRHIGGLLREIIRLTIKELSAARLFVRLSQPQNQKIKTKPQ